MLSDTKKGRIKDDDEIRFETYLNYLTAIRNYLIESYGDWNGFAIQCFENIASLQSKPGLDSAWIERFMKLAWNTEYLLSSEPPEPEIVRINNQWTPIQCYYAVYSAAEAYCCALDGQKSDGHTPTLRKMTAHLIKTGMAPWNLAYHGPQGRDKNQARPLNFPQDLRLAHNLQRHDVQPIGLIARCLKAEHTHRIDERHISQSTKGRRPKAVIDPGDTGLLHFLYRLRIKANYQKMDIFLAAPSTDRSREFFEALRMVCNWSLTMMEITLARRCRPASIFAMADRYLKINPRAGGLIDRFKFYRSIF